MQNSLGLGTAVILSIVLFLFRYQSRRIDETIDGLLCTPSDYTIIIKNIPKVKNIKQELRKLLEVPVVTNNGNTKDNKDDVQLHISKINLCYNLDKLLFFDNQIENLVNDKKK
eukprot:TRINITY_DN43666_c0_g1_i1.p3 TRINITY_DN43666_c0_g1~~TRINITY_DN43666_c0_g1_i1.p3  ORF type:complete len:113 (-),score=24.28 TRINITY_DN43666_c0_g1_i1:10-348(-)